MTNAADAGLGSFRQAVLDATSNPGPDVITFSNLSGRITLSSALPELGDLMISGPGARQLTISTKGGTIMVDQSHTATISGLRLEGSWGYLGSTISNSGTLFLKDCELVSARTYFAHGAAIYNEGRLFICSSTIANNEALAWGSDYPIPGCAAGFAGGLYVASGFAAITNSTLSGNSASSALWCSSQGGAIYVAGGSLALVNCTVAENSAAEGSAIYSADGEVTLVNTLVTDSTVGITNKAGHNLFTNDVAARLGPLQDNGGSTLTRALLADSPAIDQGASVGAPFVDQRGVSRPQGRRVDIGAFELEGIPYSFQLDLAANGPGAVSPDPGLLIFPSNAVVNVLATPDEDYAFAQWSGDATGGDNPLLVSMDRDKSIVANFKYAPATVTNSPGSTNFVSNTNSWGPGSFRQAVRDLVASSGGTILFSNLGGAIAFPLGLPRFTADARIYGPRRQTLALRFPDGFEAFAFAAGTTGMLSDLTFQSAHVTNRPGGAIFNAGDLVLKRVRFLNCRSSTNGGAVFNSGRLQVYDCQFAGNSSLSGGAICNWGDLSLVSSVFIGNGSITRTGSLYEPNRSTDEGGGAFYNGSGTAAIQQCAFVGNTACGPGDGSPGLGGAIYVADGRVGLLDTLVSSNRTFGGEGSRDSVGHVAGPGGDSRGSGIYVRDGVVGITNCTVAFNRGLAGGSPSVSRHPSGGGGGYGGGICLSTGTVFAVNCTFSGNETRGGNSGGGGFYPPAMPGGGIAGLGGAVCCIRGNISLGNCTIAGNRAFGGNLGGFFGTNFGRGLGGGIYVNTSGLTGAVALLSTILSGNTGATAGTNGIVVSDIFGPILSFGHNLIGNTSGSSNFVTSDLLNVDPLLGPLQDNGGATPTHALLASSPAIDAGVVSVLLFDQRGQPRRVDNPAIANRNGSDGADIGALEVNHLLKLTGVSTVDTNVHLRFTTVSDKTYGLEFKPDTTASSWMILPERMAGTGGIVTLTNYGAALLPTRFYRAFGESP